MTPSDYTICLPAFGNKGGAMTPDKTSLPAGNPAETPQVTVDPEMLLRTVDLLTKPFAGFPNAITELRILNSPRRGIVSGYFTKPTELCIAGGQYSGHASGVYVTLNPVHHDLLARAANRVIEWAKHTTSDADILHLCWLLIDFDPVRRSGISSTDLGHAVALQRARECRAWLQSLGWPALVLADSGNGAHLLAAIDLLMPLRVRRY